MKSRLNMSACLMRQKTILEDIYCEAPYQIMQPFYENGWMEAVIMSSSAGIFGGDYFESLFDIRENAKIRIRSQSYEKVFQRKEQAAVKKVRINAGKGAKCVYLPYPVIPFSKSRYECDTEIQLYNSSTFLYGDIFNCGRVGMEERFEMDWFHSRTKVYVDGRLAFADHTFINPVQWDYSRMGFWHGYTHNGMLYIHFPERSQEDAFLEWFRNWCEEEFRMKRNTGSPPLYWGSTKCLLGIGIRVLGTEGDLIYQAFEKAAEKICSENSDPLTP